MDALSLARIQASLTALKGSYAYLMPEWVLAASFLALVLLSAFASGNRFLPWLSGIGILLSGICLIWGPAGAGSNWQGMLWLDHLGRWGRGLLLFTGGVTVVWMSREPKQNFRPETYAMLMALLLGSMLMMMAAHLLLMYLSLELVSISSYLLTVHRRSKRPAAEAAMKYIIFGAFSSALMLYGISWWYGLTGSLRLDQAEVILSLNQFPVETQLLVIGLILAGLLFKIAAVPLHFWAPDIYQGTSFPVATFFSIAPKAGGLLMLIHLLKFTQSLNSFGEIQVIVLLVALASMSLGNLAALWQTDLKRLLAYSSIAQSGFMLLAAACRNETGETAALFYLSVYMMMNLSVFIIAAALGQSVKSQNLEDLDGLAFKFPIATVAITVGLVALVGLPPTSGFIGKWYVLMAGVDQLGQGYPTIWTITLALAVINTVISLFYYLRIPARMVLRPLVKQADSPTPLPTWVWIGIIITIPTLVLGFFGFDEVMNLI
ncbi:MAG: NADH-quinone oxidoreductase subunit N [Bacteroidota bacterium]